jgi:hypothetical protein
MAVCVFILLCTADCTDELAISASSERNFNKLMQSSKYDD